MSTEHNDRLEELEDLEQTAGADDGELDDEDLEQVAGGWTGEGDGP